MSKGREAKAQRGATTSKHGVRDVRLVKGADTRTSIQFDANQIAELRKLDADARDPRAKVVLAALRLEEASALKDRIKVEHAEAVKAYRAAQDNVQARVREIAAEHGLALDKPSAGAWSFNFETGRFTKQTQP